MHTFDLSGALQGYVLRHFVREPAVLRRLREENREHGEIEMLSSPEQGQFMAFLVKLINAERTLDIGVYLGYSALAIGLALPANGQVVCCEVNEDHISIARKYWKEAGVDRKMDVHIGPALDTLDDILKDAPSLFDFAFIDADKENYDAYYERSLRLLRRGGLLAIDNVLWCNRVLDPSDKDSTTEAIRALNLKIVSDGRVDICLAPIRDGMTLVRKR